MSLIVDDFALQFSSLQRRELSTTDSVPRSNDQRLFQVQSCTRDDLVPNLDHGLVKSLRISSQLKFAVLMNIGEPSEHIGAGDPDLVEHQPAIVFLLIAELGTQVTNLYTRKG